MNKAMPTIPKPTIQVINSTMGKIVVFRNPITKAWIGNITIAKKSDMEIEFRPNMALAKLAYSFALVAVVLALFVGCNPTEGEGAESNAPILVMGHPSACIEDFPVVPETMVKGLTKGYDYKVSTEENKRNRCFDYDSEGVACKSKTPGDSLYIIDTYCPATLKAKAEMGGD